MNRLPAWRFVGLNSERAPSTEELVRAMNPRRTLKPMGMEPLLAAVVSIGVIAGAIWAGQRLVQHGLPAKGATGTLGSVLSMIEPATGAPTRLEAAAALEEIRQRRHERLSAGPGKPGGSINDGKIILEPTQSPDVGHNPGDARI